MSKKKIVDKILDYVINKYCDDEEMAVMLEDYFKAVEKLKNRKPLVKKVKKTYYKITEDVREYLLPLVDAEYFKTITYKQNVNTVLYDAMEQLNTKTWEEIK